MSTMCSICIPRENNIHSANFRYICKQLKLYMFLIQSRILSKIDIRVKHLEALCSISYIGIIENSSSCISHFNFEVLTESIQENIGQTDEDNTDHSEFPSSLMQASFLCSIAAAGQLASKYVFRETYKYQKAQLFLCVLSTHYQRADLV